MSGNYDDPPDLDGPAFPDGDPDDLSHIGTPLDWHALWAEGDDDGERWLVEPLISAGRLVSVYSPPKAGKSLLLLEIAAGIAAGVDVLGAEVVQGPVLYVDLENDPRGDVRSRLQAFGYAPHQLAGLHYYSFPTLDALDTPRGGRDLLLLAQRHGAVLVVIDTVSRTINGDENENDTWLAFYRCSALLLKRAGIACVRLDHAGKDLSKGQRGGSAKAGDVDAVWKLTTVGDDLVRLECEAHRQPLTEKVVMLARRSYPLRHERVDRPSVTEFAAKVADLVAHLDDLEVDRSWGRDRVREVLKEQGITAGNAVLTDAIKQRRKPVHGAGGQAVSADLSTTLLDSPGAGEGE